MTDEKKDQETEETTYAIAVQKGARPGILWNQPLDYAGEPRSMWAVSKIKGDRDGEDFFTNAVAVVIEKAIDSGFLEEARAILAIADTVRIQETGPDDPKGGKVAAEIFPARWASTRPLSPEQRAELLKALDRVPRPE